MPAKKTTPAKKTPAKKTHAKKTPAKKTPAKKTLAKKTPAKKTVHHGGADADGILCPMNNAGTIIECRNECPRQPTGTPCVMKY